jgi:hypothetical protein
MAYAYNPSYSGGRDQGDRKFEASPGKIVLKTLSQKKKQNPSQKRVCGVPQGVGPEFKYQYCKKKVKKLIKANNCFHSDYI